MKAALIEAPGVVTVLLFAVVATWNNYFLPLIMLSTPSKFPLTVGLAQWQSTSQPVVFVRHDSTSASSPPPT